jgi:hypothetical protein
MQRGAMSHRDALRMASSPTAFAGFAILHLHLQPSVASCHPEVAVAVGVAATHPSLPQVPITEDHGSIDWEACCIRESCKAPPVSSQQRRQQQRRRPPSRTASLQTRRHQRRQRREQEPLPEQQTSRRWPTERGGLYARAEVRLRRSRHLLPARGTLVLHCVPHCAAPATARRPAPGCHFCCSGARAAT